MDSKKIKSAIAALVIGILVLIVIMQFSSFIVSIIGALIGGALAFFIGYNIFKEKIIEDIKSEVTKEVIIEDPSEKAINSLIALEEYIALADVGLENEIDEKVISITNSLISVIPEMNQSFSSQTITFEVTNLGEEHFPNRIKIFLGLNQSDRNSQKSKLLSDLQSMEDVIKKVGDILRNDALNKDQRESLLNDIKYGTI